MGMVRRGALVLASDGASGGYHGAVGAGTVGYEIALVFGWRVTRPSYQTKIVACSIG